MTEPIWNLSPGAFIELGPELCTECHQPKGPDCEAAEFYADPANREPAGPVRRRHGRVRVEIVADRLGREVQVDYDADMAYFEVRPCPPSGVYRTDLKLEDRSIITDYDEAGNLLGVEVFLRRSTVSAETAAALERILR